MFAVEIFFSRQGDIMAIKLQGTGGSIKLQGTGGSIKMQELGGGGGGGAQTLSLTVGGSTTAIGVGDPINYVSGDAATLSSTFASQEYAISRTDGMGQGIGTVGEVSNGNLPLSLGSVNFAAWNSTTWYYPSLETPGQAIYVYQVLTNSTFYTLNVQAAAPEGGGGGGFPIGGGGGVRPIGGGGG